MMETKDNWYVLIMAGGAGTRLYPRSRESCPKQFQKIIGGKTLIGQTYDRVSRVIPDDHIYVSSNNNFVSLLREHLPKIDPNNYILEPFKRNTAPAMALATAFIAEEDPEAIISTTASDHVVLQADEYGKALCAGMEIIQNNPGHIACIGISPTSAHTGFGYIEKGEHFIDKGTHSFYKVKRFVEKPNRENAEKYIKTGNFLWNAAYFIWQAKHFMGELERHEPELFEGIRKIISARKSSDFNRILHREFEKFKDIPVDTAIMEKTDNLIVLPVLLDWSDVGSWDAVIEMLDGEKIDANNNYSEGLSVLIDTQNCVLLGHSDKKVIATIGMKDVIVISTDDAVIIAPKGRSEDVKKVVSHLKEMGVDNLI